MTAFQPNYPPIRLALIGAGIFAAEAHVPALQKLQDSFEIAAIYSRSQASATKLAAQLPYQVDTYTDLSAVLARADLEAVNILLPIEVMPGVVELALQAGKHVISEKPIAPDVATGRRLLETYRRYPEQVWMVAENWRYEAIFEQAAEVLSQGQIGRPWLCYWAMHTPITPDNKYYHTGWRRSGGVPGGFVLDAGVHHMAVLRLLLGEIAEVSAIKAQIRPDLPPTDTLSATLRFENGVIGTYLASYATQAPWPPALHIVGDLGSLRIQRHVLEVTRQGTTRNIPIDDHQGVEAELAGFAAAVRAGQIHRNTPQQALQDVAVIEAMLRSAETGERVTPERIVGK